MSYDHTDAERVCATLRSKAASGQTLMNLDVSDLRSIPPLKRVRKMVAFIPKMRMLTCAWHPDSKHLLSIDQSAAVLMWDTTNSTTRQYFSRPLGTALAIAPDADIDDATVVAVGGVDNAISIYDMSLQAKTPEALATLPASGTSHDGMITSLAFLGTKDVLMSAGGDGDLRIWSVTKGSTSQVLRGHTKDVTSTAVQRGRRTAGETRVASCSLDGTVRLWDARVGGLATHTFDSGGVEVNDVSFFPDGNVVAAGHSDGTIHFLDLRSYGLMGKLRAERKPSSVTGIEVSLSGRAVYTSHEDGTIGVWDPLGTGGRVHTTTVDREGSTATLCLSPNGGALAVASHTGSVQIFTPKSA